MMCLNSTGQIRFEGKRMDSQIFPSEYIWVNQSLSHLLCVEPVNHSVSFTLKGTNRGLDRVTKVTWQAGENIGKRVLYPE